MSLGKTIGVGLLVAAALAVWVPALSGGSRKPAQPDQARTRSRAEAPDAPRPDAFAGDEDGSVARAPRRGVPGGERAELLLAMERLLPDGPRRSLDDLAEASPRGGAQAAAWDELALRWARRVEREGATTTEDAR